MDLGMSALVKGQSLTGSVAWIVALVTQTPGLSCGTFPKG